MNRLLEAALAYAARGWQVFPLHTPQLGGCSCGRANCDRIGKHPRTRHGLKDATTNPKIIRRWWELQWPDANIGIATGAVSGLVVVDIDPDKDGTESWFAALREHQGSVDTVEAITGGGGTHYLWAHPGEGIRIANRQEWLPGVDIRGDGGYIVAAPSLHASGASYEWEASSHPEEIPVQPLPDWLREALLGRRAAAAPTPPASGDLVPAAPVLTGCAWLQHCVQDAETLREAPWYALATIAARLVDGQSLFHVWSKPYPRYDPKETQEKFEHALRTSKPRTCAQIRHELDGESHCAACPHWGKIQSPIALGSGFAAVSDELAPPPHARITAGGLEEVRLPDTIERHRPSRRAPELPEAPPENPENPLDPPPATPVRDEEPPLTEEDVAHAAADGLSGEGRSGPSELSLARSWAQHVRKRWAFFEGAQWFRYEAGRWLYSSHERAEAELQHWLEKARLKQRKIVVTSSKVAAILRLARNHLGPHELTELNARPTWIPLRNGVYDTETGTLRPHAPEHWLTNQLPFDYDAGATCPRWEQFLAEVLITVTGQPCEEWIQAMQEWFGYCLIADARAQVAMVWVGEGQNGKGVITRVLQDLVGGTQCCSVPIDQLHDPYHRAELHGKLVGFVNEPDPRALVRNGSHFKAITGEDAISARRPTEKVFTFKPHCRLIISCNAIPSTRDLSRGFFRRLLILEFRYNVPREQRDSSLGVKLRAELPGIFNWALAGLRRFRDRGSEFEDLTESERLLSEYKLHEDTLEQFLQQECEIDDGHLVPFGAFYTAYTAWCADNGFPRVETSTKVGLRMNKMGFPQSRTGALRLRAGLRIHPESPYSAVKPSRRRSTPPLPEPPDGCESVQQDLGYDR